ncbi:MAG: hypothetical protein C0624_13095 [Desulfuromonas sp.]|nr:MAG: hypothetical protein C0624_13095 [Desulfuromonas sp.]
MALGATIYRVHLNLADMDRDYYAEHTLRLARHPSETEERLMVRLLAFALHADERLEFTRGLCVDDEPELWLKDDSGAIELWIEVGLPDEKRLRKASGRAGQVVLYSYGGHAAQLWWKRQQTTLTRHDNLRVVEVPESSSTALADIAKRNMRLQVTIQDGHVWLDNGEQSLEIIPEVRYGA